MRDITSPLTDGQHGSDLGTLWALQRNDRTSRCVLVTRADLFEVHVFVDGEPLLSQECEALPEVFELAGRWKRRMEEHGWQVAILITEPLPSNRHRSPG